MNELELQVAKQAAEIAALKQDIAEIKADLKAIRSKTDKWSGVVGLAALSIPALIGGVVGWVLHR